MGGVVRFDDFRETIASFLECPMSDAILRRQGIKYRCTSLKFQLFTILRKVLRHRYLQNIGAVARFRN